nr:MAG TPA: hypothetical protein [Bacteriophage sp.]
MHKIYDILGIFVSLLVKVYYILAFLCQLSIFLFYFV